MPQRDVCAGPDEGFQSGGGFLKGVECDQSIAAGDVAAPGRVLHDGRPPRRQVATGTATEPAAFAGDVDVFGDAPLAGALGDEVAIGLRGEAGVVSVHDLPAVLQYRRNALGIAANRQQQRDVGDTLRQCDEPLELRPLIAVINALVVQAFGHFRQVERHHSGVCGIRWQRRVHRGAPVRQRDRRPGGDPI